MPATTSNNNILGSIARKNATDSYNRLLDSFSRSTGLIGSTAKSTYLDALGASQSSSQRRSAPAAIPNQVSYPSYATTSYSGGGSSVSSSNRQAADNQTALSKQNIRDVKHQLSRQLANYDFADAQNRALADTQLKQNSRKNSADRFEAQRALQQSALGLLGSMGQAMNGSSTGNLMRMLESRNDSDNNTFWAQHQVNQDSIENAYQDSLNQNRVARRDAMQSAEKAIRDIAADWSANMGSIDPDYFTLSAPGGDNSYLSATAWQPERAQQNNAQISGYVIPDNRGVGTTVTGQRLPSQSMNVGDTRNRMQGTDYFSQLMNRFNGR